MNEIPQLFAGNDTMLFVATILLQATVVIVLALVSSRLLRHQPVLRHSVLVGAMVCVCCLPAASYIGDQLDAHLLEVAWPASQSKRTDFPQAILAKGASNESQHARGPSQVVETRDTLPSEVLHTELASELSSAADRALPSVATQPLSRGTIDVDSAADLVAEEAATGATGPVSPVSPSRSISRALAWTNASSIAATIWLTGLAVISIRLLLAWRYLHRLQSISLPLDAGTLPRFQTTKKEVLQAIGVERLPPLLVSNEVRGPISVGLLRPAIILPSEMIQALDSAQLRDVLVHEMAHIHRHDHLVVLLQRLAGAIFWPFPLVWRLNTRIDEAREDVCDNYVLRLTEASQYSRMLLELTEQASPQAIPFAIGLWKCRRKLEHRVTALLDPRRTTGTRLPRLTLCTLGVALMSIVVLLAGSRVTSTSDIQAAEPPQLGGEEKNQQAHGEQEADARAAAPAVASRNDSKPDPYDTLYDVIMTRWKDGKAYAQNETSPAIFSWSEFPFDDQTFDKFNAALDAFAALPQEKIEQYNDVQRALMQRNLWEIFEYTFNWDWPEDWWWEGQRSFPKSHMGRRAIAQPKIAALIKRLALTKDQIHALPNTLAATVESAEFARAHNPAQPLKPFLPPDLYGSPESSWICVGEDGEEIPADLHTGRVYSRSMFLQFMRLPGGREETLQYMERLSKRPHQFPVGTQFALLERPFLISKEGELVLSPLVVSVQLRAYLDVGRDFRRSDDEPQATQCVAEFVMQPRQLMAGNAVMRAAGPNDFHFDAGAETPTPGFSSRDPFMTGKLAGDWPPTRLEQCMDCHSRAGGRGIRTRSFRRTRSFFTEGNPTAIAKATAAQKLKHDEYTTLQKYWRGEPVELPKSMARKKPKPVPKPDRFPDTPELRTALLKGVETEVVAELKTLHSAVLVAEAAKLADIFDLDRAAKGKLRLAAMDAANSAVNKARDSLRKSYGSNAEYVLNKKELVDGSRNDPDLTAFRFNDRFIILDESDQDPADRNKYDCLGFELERRGSNDWLYVGFKFGRFGNTVRPKDADVQEEEAWREALSAVLTDEQVTQYAEHKANRLKNTVVDLLITALQFDLDLADSQLPAVRSRIEERVKIRSSYDDIERMVEPELQRLKAEDLDDILSEEQLNAFPEHPESRIKSTVISLVLTSLKFDLHLADSHLPDIRKCLEELIPSIKLNSSVESKAMRVRWGLKENDLADVLSEAELTLWRFTQEQHN